MKSSQMLSDESGYGLIEVIVSAVLLVIVSVGVLSAVEAASRSGTEERHRAQAHGIAQEDQARMRAMNIDAVSNLDQTRTVRRDGSDYTVVSRGDYVTDSTGTSTCTSGTASADYIKTTSTVTWPTIGGRPPVVTESIVAPPNGSISSSRGALAITVMDSRSNGIPGVGLSGSGAGSFGGSTGPTGCALFGNLPEGNYTLSASASGKVDKDGNAPSPQPTSVLGGSTNTVVLQYDDPGSAPVTFRYRVGSTSTFNPSSADSLVFFNTGMTQARTFGTPGTRTASITGSSLYPFTSPYSAYAGLCTANNPSPGGPAALATVTVPVGGAAANSIIQLPALNVTVYKGSGTGSARATDATIKVYDLDCPNIPTAGFSRTLSGNSQGQLDDPGLPWSTYNVCVSGTANNGTIRRRITGTANSPANPVVQNLASGTTLDMTLSGTGSAVGVCP